MAIIIDENENSRNNGKIMTKSNDVCHWYFLMGRPVCGCGWSAIDDWPEGGGYMDHTPWLIFKNHVKEKHGLDVKVFTEE